eukprot:14533253-Alexandrium_andersonii.AAC.1
MHRARFQTMCARWCAELRVVSQRFRNAANYCSSHAQGYRLKPTACKELPEILFSCLLLRCLRGICSLVRQKHRGADTDTRNR